jgi:hypothetical protein
LRKKINLKKNAFAVRIANGSRANLAGGFAPIAIIQNISMADALRVGTHSTPAAFVRVVLTAGFGLHACVVQNGRGTLIGMRTIFDKIISMAI